MVRHPVLKALAVFEGGLAGANAAAHQWGGFLFCVCAAVLTLLLSEEEA